MRITKTLIDSYPFLMHRLGDEDGGGFMIEYADLPGCVSDGETPEEAVANGRDAVKAYLLSCLKYKDSIPKPGSASGQWRQRVPRSLHARLTSRARQEGVSLNALVMTFVAEGLGRHQGS
jgi:antitoxin HicB